MDRNRFPLIKNRMKRCLFLVLFFIFVAATCLYVDEASFSPLGDGEFKLLFPDYGGGAKKTCSIDFLGFNFKSEFFGLYSYRVGRITIDPTYPNSINEWENKKVNTDVLIPKWKKCPVDSATMKFYEFSLTANGSNKEKCNVAFLRDLNNPKSYYSYIYFNELENYFLLYCTESESLYYIRRKGF